MVVRIKEKEKYGISTIKPTLFYSCESEKTKLNWFCYELSMGMYDNMKDNIGKKLKKYKISDEVLAEFSIYMSKKIRDVILEVISGKSGEMCFFYEVIEEYFPNFNDRMVNKMLDALSKAWDELRSFCKTCPVRCLSESDVYCAMFNNKDLF